MGPKDADGFPTVDMKSDQRYPSYPACKAAAIAAGHEVDNLGWLHKLTASNFNHHAIDGYPTWDTEQLPGRVRPHAPFVKLDHMHKLTPSSNDLMRAWDDVAQVDFYTRDWSGTGSIFVSDGDHYTSGWWFATKAERDRFVAWLRGRSGMETSP